MRNIEREPQPLQFGHKDLWSLLHIADRLDMDTSTSESEPQPIDLGTIRSQDRNKTVSTLHVRPVGLTDYEVLLLTQQIASKDVVRWNDTRLTIPPAEDKSLVTVREHTYDTHEKNDEAKQTTRLAIYRASPDDPMRQAWFHGLSQRILGGIREKILAHKKMSYQSGLFAEISEFTGLHARHRLEEVRRHTTGFIINLMPVIAETEPYQTRLLPRILLTGDEIRGNSSTHIVSKNAFLYVDPALFGVPALDPLPDSASEQDQDKLLQELANVLFDPRNDRIELYERAEQIIELFSMHARDLDEGDISVIGHFSILDMFLGEMPKHELPLKKTGEPQPLYEASGVERSLVDADHAEYAGTSPWQNNLAPSKIANLMLGIFHDRNAASGIL